MDLPDTIELLPAEEYAKRFCVSQTTVFEWKEGIDRKESYIET